MRGRSAVLASGTTRAGLVRVDTQQLRRSRRSRLGQRRGRRWRAAASLRVGAPIGPGAFRSSDVGWCQMTGISRPHGRGPGLEPEVRGIPAGIHQHRVCLEGLHAISVLWLHGVDKLGHRSDAAAAVLDDLLGRGRPEDVVALAVRRRGDGEDAAARVERQRPLVVAHAALADGRIRGAVDALVGRLPACALAAWHRDVVEERGAVGEGGDLAAAGTALVLPARVVAHGGAARLEDVDAGALVVVDHVALNHEPAGVSLVAAVAGTLSGAAGEWLAGRGAGAGAVGVLEPAAGCRGLVARRAGSLRDVEDDAVALGVAGALAAALRGAAVPADALVALAVGVDPARAAIALRRREMRVGVLIPGAGVLVRGRTAAVLRQAPERRIVLVVPDGVAADHVGALVLADRVPEVHRRRPAVSPVVVDLVVLEGDARGAVRVQHAAAVVVRELRVADRDVGRRAEAPVDEEGVLRRDVARVAGARVAVPEAPVLEPESVDDGLVARPAVAAVGAGGTGAPGGPVGVVGGAVLARARACLAESHGRRDAGAVAVPQPHRRAARRHLAGGIDDGDLARVRPVGDGIGPRAFLHHLQHAHTGAAGRADARHRLRVGAAAHGDEVAGAYRLSGGTERAPGLRSVGRRVVGGGVAVAAVPALRVVVDPERAQRGRESAGAEQQQDAGKQDRGRDGRRSAWAHRWGSPSDLSVCTVHGRCSAAPKVTDASRALATSLR